MIELKQVKVFPLHNPNMVISNTDELSDMIGGTPIVVDFDNEKSHMVESKIIGMVTLYGDVNIIDGYIVADIVLYNDEYKDYVFKNYEVKGEFDRMTGLYEVERIACIEFGRSE